MKRLSEVLGEVPNQQPVELPVPNCERCGDGGLVRYERKIGDADFGKAEPCTCLPSRQWKQYTPIGAMGEERLSLSSLDRFMDKVAVEGATGFLMRDPMEGTLLIQGVNSSGKTHLSAGIAEKALNKGTSVVFANVTELIDKMRSQMLSDSENSLAALVMDCPFLILDGFDSPNPTDWTKERLTHILKHREEVGLPTVVTSTYDKPSWARFYPALVKRITNIPWYIIRLTE